MLNDTSGRVEDNAAISLPKTPIGSAQSLPKPKTELPPPPFNLTEAEILASGHRDRDMARLVKSAYGSRIAVIPVHLKDPFAVFDPKGHKWEMQAGAQVREFIDQVTNVIDWVVDKRGVKKADAYNAETDRLRAFSGRYQDDNRRRSAARVLADDATLAHPLDEWETLPEEFACPDGRKINLVTGVRTSIEPEDRILLMAAALAPTPTDIRNADESFVVSVIRQIFEGREDLIPFYRRALFYTLRGCRDEKAWFFIRGRTQTGKTTLMAMMFALMGAYADTMEFSAIEHVDGLEKRFTMGRYPNIRFVWIDETPLGKKINALKLKALTGGGKIEGELKYRDAFFYQPKLALWMTSNYQLDLFNDDGAMWERERLFVLERVFSPSERKKEYKLPEFWLPHAKDLLAWILGAREEYWAKGLAEMPERMVEDLGADREDTDWLGRFLRQHCKVGETEKIALKSLYAVIRRWREQYGHKPMGYDVVKKQVREKGFKITRDEEAIGVAIDVATLDFELAQANHC